MLGSQVRDLIAPVLRECPRECGIVSITAVDVSTDASYATVYVTALSKPEAALAFLERRRHDLQRRLSALNRKKIPMLRFRLDKTEEGANAVEELLKKLEGGKA